MTATKPGVTKRGRADVAPGSNDLDRATWMDLENSGEIWRLILERWDEFMPIQYKVTCLKCNARYVLVNKEWPGRLVQPVPLKSPVKCRFCGTKRITVATEQVRVKDEIQPDNEDENPFRILRSEHGVRHNEHDTA